MNQHSDPANLAAIAVLAALCGCVDGGSTPASEPDADPVMAAILAYAEDQARPYDRDVPSSLLGEVYRLREIDSEDVDQVMIVGDGSTGLPPELHGLWWMDGNPLADEVISFGGQPWDAATRTTRIVVYDEGVWSWHGDLEGRALYGSARASKLIYEIAYDEDLAFAQITPTVAVGPVRVRVPASIVRFTATRLADGLWIRHSYLYGRLVHAYALRRIVRGDGAREPAYDEYVAAAPPTSLVAERVR